MVAIGLFGGSEVSGTIADVLTRCVISHKVGPRMSGMPQSLCQLNGDLTTTRSSTKTNTNCDRLATETLAGSPEVNALVKKNWPMDAVTPTASSWAVVSAVISSPGSFHGKKKAHMTETTSAVPEKCTTTARGSKSLS